jgi:hypothetical protein
VDWPRWGVYDEPSDQTWSQGQQETVMSKHQNPRDAQEPHTGKVANDTNKMGDQDATQLNQGQRTPDSRSDREAHVGGSNQSQSRRGTQGGPKP